MTNQQRKQRDKQIEWLADHLGISTYEAESVYRKLRRIECRLHRITEDYANGEIDDIDADLVKAHVDIDKILPALRGKIYINTDPRGYAIKLRQPHDHPIRDWGGYGILCGY